MLRLHAAEIAPLVWLHEFFAPAFTVEQGPPRAADIPLHFDVDAHEHARLETALARATAAEIDGVSFDGRFSIHRSWTETSGHRWAHDAERDLYYGAAADHRSFRIVARTDDRRQRIGYMRVVREIATSARLADGNLPIHAAAFARGDEVVLVCGQKRSGKTTLLTHALECGASFVANDRVFVESHAPFVVHGMPTIVALRAGTLGMLPHFGERFDAARFEAARTMEECGPGVERPAPEVPPGKERAPVSPSQFCALAGASMRASGRAGLCLFPRLDPSVSGIRLSPVKPADAVALLMGSLLRPSRPLRGSDLFKLEPARTLWSSEEEERRCREFLAAVPAWECRLGADAYQADLLATLERAS
ncbi:MAG: hypothetical protein AB7F99_15725 [Vicinamibacterales bacterium]